MDIPNEYICPITQEIMKEPVSDNEGVSYEKYSIERWLSRHNTSPVSRRPLYIRDLRPNIALKNLISAFNEKNKGLTETLTMREARLKRFDGSLPSPQPCMGPPPGIPQPGMGPPPGFGGPPGMGPPPGFGGPPGMQSVREPDPITHETLIPDDPYPEDEEGMVFGDPSYTIPESITTFGGKVIQITDSTVDSHKYLCKNYCCVNIPMPSTGYCKKCRDMSRTGIDISQSWNPKHLSFKNHKGYIKNYLKSRCPQEVEQVFELETKDKFKCARHVIKDIRTHHLKNIRISDYPVSIDDEDILPYLRRFFN